MIPPDPSSNESAADLKSKPGFGRILSAARYSAEGFLAAWRDEHAFRQELFVVLPAVILAAFLPVTLTQKALLIGVTLLILIVELLNSAVEATVDLVTGNRHPLAKKAKDIGSAAVMLSFGVAILTWALVLTEHYAG